MVVTGSDDMEEDDDDDDDDGLVSLDDRVCELYQLSPVTI